MHNVDDKFFDCRANSSCMNSVYSSGPVPGDGGFSTVQGHYFDRSLISSVAHQSQNPRLHPKTYTISHQKPNTSIKGEQELNLHSEQHPESDFITSS